MANHDTLDGGVSMDASADAMSNDPVDGGAIAGCPEGPPQPCPTDFDIIAPCRFVKTGGSLTIRAADPHGYAGGTFTWSTTSPKIRLSATTGSSVTVSGLANASAARDAEVISVTRTGFDCAPVTKTVQITVAKVTFSKSNSQRYGYDDMDTAGNNTDDHICVKKMDHTFVHVHIEGGLLGTDFNFVCDNAGSCTTATPPGSADFDLRLNAGGTNKDNTTLHARPVCSASETFGSIGVHVYKERVVDVVVAKIDNPHHTFLRYATADYASHAATANDKLKEAVVKYNIENFRPDNSILPVAFVSGTGVLSYDITAADHGPDLVAIQTGFTAAANKTRVAIIKDLKSYYYLDADAPAGQNWVRLRGATAGNLYLTVGSTYPIGNTGDTITIVSKNEGTVVFTPPLTRQYNRGTTVEFNAAGWSSDPILIQEGNAALTVAKWTVLHEVGHRQLNLSDVTDTSDFMHYSQDWVDYRLRWCGRACHYNPPGGHENQWDLIPRT